MQPWIDVKNEDRPELNEVVLLRMSIPRGCDSKGRELPTKAMVTEGRWQPFQRCWIAGSGPFIAYGVTAWRRKSARRTTHAEV